MKTSSYQVSNKQLLLAAIFIMAAVILLAAALMEPKMTATGEWVPLNDAVETAVASLAKSNEAEGAGESGMKAVAEAKTGAKAEVEVEAEANKEGKLDINRATAEELDELKGIGPSKAQAIIQDRDENGKFSSVNDLLRVKGIGEKLLSGIQESIVARP